MKGAYHSTKNFEIFETGTNGTEISWVKVPENREIFEWRSEPLNRQFRKLRDEGRMGRKFPGKMFENLGILLEVVLFFGIYANFQFLLSASYFFWPRSQRAGHFTQGDGNAHSADKRNTQ